MTTDNEQTPPTEAAPRAARARRLLPWLRRLGLFGAGVLAVFLALGLYGAIFPGPAPLSQQDVNDSISRALASQTPGPALSEQAYAAIRPSLVLIQTGSPAASPGSSPGSSGDPGTSTLGSGVVIDDAGDIMTSLHIVADATTIQLTFADGSQTTATIKTRETDKDIAVLQPAQVPASITPATLGNPGSVRVGSQVFVVGNPFGLVGSLSAGVVSGLERTFQEPDGGPQLTGLIQVDAAVNPGNSGGPLIDRDGRVIGIVTALVNPTQQDVFIGIGLAVPIDVAGGGAGLPQY